MTTTHSASLGPLLQDYFCNHLISQRQVSARTVATYRDVFRLLLHYAEAAQHLSPSTITITDLDAPLVLTFLDHLEKERHNSARTRNARLAAIRSFLHYAALKEPAALGTIQAVFAIPLKRHDRPTVRYLSVEQITAILNAPDPSTWSGQRDRVLLATLYNTGARISELIAIRCGDLELQPGRAVRLHGKGRKERIIPLWKKTAEQLRRWIPRIDEGSHLPLIPNRFGQPMSRTGVEQRLAAAVRKGSATCPSLCRCQISPHVIRHTTAMHLLQSGVDLTVIALWLGHESVETTHGYVQADLAMKEQALSKLQPPTEESPRYRPSSDILAFLDSL